MLMRLIRISAVAHVSLNASLRVALHVTKRHTDTTAIVSLGITGVTQGNTFSQEQLFTELSDIRQ
jgi:hypothetical protein